MKRKNAIDNNVTLLFLCISSSSSLCIYGTRCDVAGYFIIFFLVVVLLLFLLLLRHGIARIKKKKKCTEERSFTKRIIRILSESMGHKKKKEKQEIQYQI